MKQNFEIKVYASVVGRPCERADKPCYRQVLYGVEIEEFDFPSVIKAIKQLYPQIQPHLVFEITEL